MYINESNGDYGAVAISRNSQQKEEYGNQIPSDPFNLRALQRHRRLYSFRASCGGAGGRAWTREWVTIGSCETISLLSYKMARLGNASADRLTSLVTACVCDYRHSPARHILSTRTFGQLRLGLIITSRHTIWRCAVIDISYLSRSTGAVI